MSKERIAGIMMGIGVGVAIGYYLRPHENGSTTERAPKLKSEAADRPPASTHAKTTAAGAK